METSAPPATPRPRIAILGGGISGLACAFWLTELMPGARLTLYESAGRLGGLIQTRREGPYLLESGPLSFPTCAPATRALVSQTGQAAACLPSGSPAGISLWDGRRIVPVPKTPWDVLMRNLLPLRALARLVAEPFIPRAAGAGDMSILEFFRRRTGEGFFASLMEPMAAGILAGDPASLSMAANLPRLLAMERKSGSLARGFGMDLFRKRPAGGPPGAGLPTAATTAGGCSALVDAIAAGLERKGVELRTSQDIRAVHRTPAGYLVRASGGAAREEPPFDGVVSALPSHALAGVEADWPPGVADFLRSVPHVPLSVVYLAYPRSAGPQGIPCDGLLPQPKAGEDILSCFVPSRMAPGRCPEEQHLLRFLVGGARKPRLAGLEDSQAVDLAGHAARRLFGLSGAPAHSRVIRHPACLPQLVVGHMESLDRCRKALRRDWPGFFLAGTSCQGPGIENAVTSGRLAASEAAVHFLPAGERNRSAHG